MNSNLLHFTAGSLYRTRNGLKAIVYAVYPATESNNFPIHGAIWKDGSPVAITWTDKGTAYSLDHSFDLVSPWADPVEFDVSVVPPWFDSVAYAQVINSWFMHGNRVDSSEIPLTYAPKNADKSKTYRIDREKGVLVEL